jgi:hypothetical protein
LILIRNVLGWNADADLQVDVGLNLRENFLPPHLLDRAFQHLAVQVKSDRVDVPMLFASQQITGTS